MSSRDEGGGERVRRQHSTAVRSLLAFLSLLGFAALAWGLRDLLVEEPNGAVKVFWGGLLLLSCMVALATIAISDHFDQANPSQREREHDQPWLRRRDWAQGRVECSNRQTVWNLWVFVVAWNVIWWMVWWMVRWMHGPLREAIAGGGTLSYLILLFPLIGFALVVWAVYETLRQAHFGISVLELETVPGVIGGELRGRVQTRIQKRPKGPFYMVLTCTHHWQTKSRFRTASGRNQATTQFHHEVLWRSDYEVSPDELGIGPRGLSAPVRFRIPLGLRSTNIVKEENRIIWNLNAVAELPGPDYEGRFDVPIFVTEESKAETEQERRERLDAVERVDPARSTSAAATVRQTPGGGLEFLLPVQFTAKDRAGATVFTLLLGASTAAILYFGLPVPIAVIVGLLALFMAVATIATFCFSSSLTVEGGEIRLHKKFFGLGKVRRYRAADVTHLEVGRLQKEAGAAQPKSWQIEIVTRGGQREDIGAVIDDRDQAEWLAAEIERLLLARDEA